MTVLHFGLTPKMKPVSPKRAATVAALDIGTSKIVCLIARLAPKPPQDPPGPCAPDHPPDRPVAVAGLVALEVGEAEARTPPATEVMVQIVA